MDVYDYTFIELELGRRDTAKVGWLLVAELDALVAQKPYRYLLGVRFEEVYLGVGRQLHPWHVQFFVDGDVIKVDAAQLFPVCQVPYALENVHCRLSKEVIREDASFRGRKLELRTR